MMNVGKAKTTANKLLMLRSGPALVALGGGADRVTVGAVVVSHREAGPCILVLRRAATEEEYAGIEELPSGAVDAGESLGEALRREVKEECGFDLKCLFEEWFIIRYDSRKGRTIQVNCVAAVPSTWDVKINPEEHEAYRWVPRGAVQASDLTANVKRALAELPWESLSQGES